MPISSLLQFSSGFPQLCQFFLGLVLFPVGGEDTHILQMQIVEERLLILIERAAVHMVAAGTEEQRRLFEALGLIQRVDAVDCTL